MTSAFDDDFDYNNNNFVNVNNFNDEDDDVVDSWEDVLDEEEMAEKERKLKEAEAKRKQDEKDDKVKKREEERRNAEKLQELITAKPLSKEEQERAQLESDMKNASDLFGEEIVPVVRTERTSTAAIFLSPDSIDNYFPIEPDDLDELRRRVVLKLKKYETDEGFHNFVKCLTEDLISEMSSEEIKKISNPLVNVAHDKAREEKEAKKKVTSSKKGQLNVAKNSTTNSNLLMDDYIDDDYEGYDDTYDFM